MTEAKYKLKKAGVCVGYMRIAPWGTAPMQVAYLQAGDDQWGPVCRFVFDAFHPCVCQDRNGQNVYDRDRITVDSPFGRDKATVFFNAHTLAWWIKRDGSCYDDLASNTSSIELIEEAPRA